MGVTQIKGSTLRVYGKSDIGMVREENQDSFRVTVPDDSDAVEARGRLLVLADGMGGLAHGGQASQIAVENISREYFTDLEEDFPAALERAVESANGQIHREAQQLPGGQPMGSTLTAMAIVDNRAVIAQVGDSRAYRIAEEGGLTQITHDHTLVQELADRGEIEPDSLHYLLNRNVLTRGLGLQDEVEVDLFHIDELQIGDTYLLCSDGLYDVVADSEIESHVLSYGSAIEDLVHYLLELARSRGAPDNVTIVVARVEAEDVRNAQLRTRLSSGRPGAEGGKESTLVHFLTPLTYFIAFALGVGITLLVSSPDEHSAHDERQALDVLIDRPPSDYPGAEDLRRALEGYRTWLREKSLVEDE